MAGRSTTLNGAATNSAVWQRAGHTHAILRVARDLSHLHTSVAPRACRAAQRLHVLCSAAPAAAAGSRASAQQPRREGGKKRLGPVRKPGGKGRPARAEPQRLAKVLARCGVASRRKAEEWVFAGRVAVNGAVVTAPQTLVVPGKDKVTLNGKPVSLSAAPELYYFAANKPKGYLCASAATSEERGGLVIDLFKQWLARWSDKRPQGVPPPRLFTVGRLDVQNAGLVLVTNDGQWAQQVSHPSTELTNEYVVTLNRAPTRAELDVIAGGCEVDGAFVTPAGLALEESDPRSKSKLRIVVAEGRSREVRLLVAAAGLEVAALKRVRIGGYRMPRDLAPGKFVALKPHEVRRVTNKGAQLLM